MFMCVGGQYIHINTVKKGRQLKHYAYGKAKAKKESDRKSVIERTRERGRERDRQTDRQTNRQTDRKSGSKHTERVHISLNRMESFPTCSNSINVYKYPSSSLQNCGRLLIQY